MSAAHRNAGGAPDRPGKPKKGTFLWRALVQQGGRGRAVTAAERETFQRRYAETHKGTQVADAYATVMIRQLMANAAAGKGTKALATYGLREPGRTTPPPQRGDDRQTGGGGPGQRSAAQNAARKRRAARARAIAASASTPRRMRED